MRDVFPTLEAWEEEGTEQGRELIAGPSISIGNDRRVQ